MSLTPEQDELLKKYLVAQNTKSPDVAVAEENQSDTNLISGIGQALSGFGTSYAKAVGHKIDTDSFYENQRAHAAKQVAKAVAEAKHSGDAFAKQAEMRNAFEKTNAATETAAATREHYKAQEAHDRAMLNATRIKAQYDAAAKAAKPKPLTATQKVADEQFAKGLEGRQPTQANNLISVEQQSLDRLEGMAQVLEESARTGRPITGNPMDTVAATVRAIPGAAGLGDTLSRNSNQSLALISDEVRKSILPSLKVLLGGQFTAVENQMVQDLYIDSQASPDQLARKLRELRAVGLEKLSSEQTSAGNLSRYGTTQPTDIDPTLPPIETASVRDRAAQQLPFNPSSEDIKGMGPMVPGPGGVVQAASAIPFLGDSIRDLFTDKRREEAQPGRTQLKSLSAPPTPPGGLPPQYAAQFEQIDARQDINDRAKLKAKSSLHFRLNHTDPAYQALFPKQP